MASWFERFLEVAGTCRPVAVASACAASTETCHTGTHCHTRLLSDGVQRFAAGHACSNQVTTTISSNKQRCLNNLTTENRLKNCRLLSDCGGNECSEKRIHNHRKIERWPLISRNSSRTWMDSRVLHFPGLTSKVKIEYKATWDERNRYKNQFVLRWKDWNKPGKMSIQDDFKRQQNLSLWLVTRK